MEEAPKTNKFIPEGPHLRYIEKTLSLLESDIGPDGEKINWKNLHDKVGPWNSGLELSDEIRDIVREYLLSKFPKIKERIPSIEDLPDLELLNALSHGWFEELGEEVSETRTEILLAVLGHITKKIETRIYKKVLEEASEDEIQKLGLPPNMRQLVIDCLDASVKSDPLFISKKLSAILENGQLWKNEPGADEFLEYLGYLAQFFSEKDIEKSKELHKKVEKTYGQLISSDFPLIIVPPLEGYYKPPYLDPELKVAIRTPESRSQEDNFRTLQEALADKLDKLGVGQFTDDMRKRVIRSFISIGYYGVGITFNAVAQEEPAITLFINDQIRAYDINLKKFLPLVDGSERFFSGVTEQ